VIYRNLKNEMALAHIGLLHQKEGEKEREGERK
jgi:hypothetical protein